MGIGGVGVFVFYGRDHSDCGVQPVVVVPAADPHGDLLSGLGFGCPGAAVDELVLEGGEERLGGGLSVAPLSSGECLGLFSGVFVAPHSADDSVGELSFVGSSGLASGFAFGGFSGKVGGWLGLGSLLGDRCDVEH